MKSSLYYQERTGNHIYEDQETGKVVVEFGDYYMKLFPEEWDLVFRVIKERLG